MLEELSLHVLDIGMNAIAANATRVEITILDSARHDRLMIRVRDNGRGMDPATLDRVLKKSWSTKKSRKKPIGLGLAMLRQTAEMCGGGLTIRSAPGRGTSVLACMRRNHIDRPPVGDLESTILALCAAAPQADIRLRYRADNGSFEFSSAELRQSNNVG